MSDLSDRPNLLPCPFCEAAAEIEQFQVHKGSRELFWCVFARCQDCRCARGVIGGLDDLAVLVRDAAAAWNRLAGGAQ